MKEYLIVFFKLTLSVAMGALIGFEREHKNRPAGLRTNILVCLGSTLVQIISIEIFDKYKGIANIDPARLGAQVISGIGFLGAGTIIREGASVKGLTTAASLWVVACIGLAIGNGSYIPAIIAAIFAFLTLTMLKGVERKMSDKNSFMDLELLIEDRPGQIGSIGQILGNMSVDIKSIEFKDYKDERLVVNLGIKLPYAIGKEEVIKSILKDNSVISVRVL